MEKVNVELDKRFFLDLAVTSIISLFVCNILINFFYGDDFSVFIHRLVICNFLFLCLIGIDCFDNRFKSVKNFLLNGFYVYLGVVIGEYKNSEYLDYIVSIIFLIFCLLLFSLFKFFNQD